MSEEAAVLLEAAAVEIEKNGWRHGDRGTVDGAKCAWGALVFCRTGEMWTTDSGIDAGTDPLLKECWAAAGGEVEPRISSLVAYNDMVAPEKRYVTRLLRRTARKMRKREAAL